MRPATLSSVRCALLSSVVPVLVLFQAAPACSQPPRILIHVGSPGASNPCARPIASCDKASTSGALMTPQFAYLIANHWHSLAGIECGITYDSGLPSDRDNGAGIDIFSWNLCADAFYPAAGPNQWPRPGGGAIIVWDPASHCQGAIAVAGYFYMTAYTPGVLQVTRRPNSGQAKVAGCNGNETIVMGKDLGSAAFGGGSGCNPCMTPCPDPPTPPYVPPIDIPPPPPQEGDPGVPWVLLHALPASGGNACAKGELDDPADAVVSASLTVPDEGPYYNVYLLVARDQLTSLSGIACGITYENGNAAGRNNGTGVDILSWTLCADVELRSGGSAVWPAPGSGNLIVWNPQGNCRTGAVEVAGYFYVAAYSADELAVVANGPHGVEVVNCYVPSTVVPVENLGSVSFSEGGSVAGSNPWLDAHPADEVPVRSATWSGIKALYSAR